MESIHTLIHAKPMEEEAASPVTTTVEEDDSVKKRRVGQGEPRGILTIQQRGEKDEGHRSHSSTSKRRDENTSLGGILNHKSTKSTKHRRDTCLDEDEPAEARKSSLDNSFDDIASNKSTKQHRGSFFGEPASVVDDLEASSHRKTSKPDRISRDKEDPSNRGSFFDVGDIGSTSAHETSRPQYSTSFDKSDQLENSSRRSFLLDGPPTSARKISNTSLVKPDKPNRGSFFSTSETVMDSYLQDLEDVEAASALRKSNKSRRNTSLGKDQASSAYKTSKPDQDSDCQLRGLADRLAKIEKLLTQIAASLSKKQSKGASEHTVDFSTELPPKKTSRRGREADQAVQKAKIYYIEPEDISTKKAPGLIADEVLLTYLYDYLTCMLTYLHAHLAYMLTYLHGYIYSYLHGSLYDYLYGYLSCTANSMSY
ncbi:unnamed protein product [Zymoseptoria tritici ST99CH_1A5]|uniref:Uncharacterized protein n=1 Tax=Zymoseptoria tritici ST99CH_1A5 TaxID=1276529 RepID=A0A1Y6LX43_ZYMTR|nr:unnamed protein product [Zymoseptoria tritici ST99CH_1A5]